MTVANHHRIQRQVLELDLASPSRAAELQEEAARLFRDPPAPELQELFDQLAGPHEVLRLERLELDLGDLRGPDWRTLFLERLLAQLRESLEKAAAQTPSRPGGPESSLPGTLEVRFRQLLFFLSRGRLPWWGGKPRKNWADIPPKALGGERWKALGELLRGDTRARRRLIHSVDDDFLGAAIEALAALRESQRVLALTAPPGPPAGLARRWRERFWTLLIDFAIAGGPGRERGRRLLERLLEQRLALAGTTGETATGPRRQPSEAGRAGSESRRLADRAAEETGRRPGTVRPGAGETALPRLPQPWQGWLEAVPKEREGHRETAARPPGKERASDEPPSAGRTPPTAQRDETPGDPRAARPDEDYLPDREPIREPGLDHDPGVRREEDEAIYLEGAGAVLLHPFLEELFEGRELLSERDFRNEAARHRAVHLLGYLTFGSDEVPEHDLLLAKLLCALPWEEPLPSGELEAADRESCDRLMKAVLKHWEAVRSASPSWLRQQFFLREGKLEGVDQGFKLTVERRAQDVLLDKLPWGLGLIRLPWMPGFLHVSWTD